MTFPKVSILHVCAIVSAGAAILYVFLLEPRWIDVTYHQLGSSASDKKIRIVQISDLHLQGFGPVEQRLADTIVKLSPDLIVFSGDIVDRPDTLPFLRQFLSATGSSSKVAVLGNWEYWSDVDFKALTRVYAEVKTQLLINQSVVFKIKNRQFNVLGLDDFTAGQPMAPFQSTELGLRILIQHSPGYFEDHSALNAGVHDLCLSGHTHGGQITLFGIPIWTPRGSGKFKSGMYETKNCPLYVSRGIGTSVLSARLGARPEVAVFDL